MKKVAIIMGSDSDLPVVKKAVDVLREYEVPFEVHVLSAHRTPEQAKTFASLAAENGFGVIIAAAGKAAHLAGAIAANTVLPVIGVPISGANLEGLGSEKPYYYATLQDFEASRLQTELNPDLGKTFVYGVTFVPGEQIIPKVNKSVQSLGAASLAEIESKGPSYFVAQMRQNYTRTCPMSVYDVDGGTAYTNNSSESILSVVRSKDEIIYA